MLRQRHPLVVWSGENSFSDCDYWQRAKSVIIKAKQTAVVNQVRMEKLLPYDTEENGKRYLFRVAEDLLDIDVLEMDRTLKHLLRALPEGGEVRLFLYSDGIGNRENSRNSEPLVCTVDHAQGIIVGNGLGALWRRIMRTPASGSRYSPIGAPSVAAQWL